MSTPWPGVPGSGERRTIHASPCLVTNRKPCASTRSPGSSIDALMMPATAIAAARCSRCGAARSCCCSPVEPLLCARPATRLRITAARCLLQPAGWKVLVLASIVLDTCCVADAAGNAQRVTMDRLTLLYKVYRVCIGVSSDAITPGACLGPALRLHRLRQSCLRGRCAHPPAGCRDLGGLLPTVHQPSLLCTEVSVRWARGHLSSGPVRQSRQRRQQWPHRTGHLHYRPTVPTQALTATICTGCKSSARYNGVSMDTCVFNRCHGTAQAAKTGAARLDESTMHVGVASRANQRAAAHSMGASPVWGREPRESSPRPRVPWPRACPSDSVELLQGQEEVRLGGRILGGRWGKGESAVASMARVKCCTPTSQLRSAPCCTMLQTACNCIGNGNLGGLCCALWPRLPPLKHGWC